MTGTIHYDDTVARLTKIWTDVLQAQVTAYETFLDLGGDSLTAMSCIVLTRTAFGIEFTVGDFLIEDSTVATFAARIDAADADR